MEASCEEVNAPTSCWGELRGERRTHRPTNGLFRRNLVVCGIDGRLARQKAGGR